MNTPLRIRATLQTGIAHAAPWGISLDGLLAAELWAAHKQSCRAQGLAEPRAKADPNPPDLELPLARCECSDGTWHWAATCAYPEDQDQAQPDIHYVLGYTDQRVVAQLAAGLPSKLSARQGRYRTRRLPILVTPTRALTWHAVGDGAAIAELLEGVGSIGKKRAAGEGVVRSWTVEAAPDLTYDQASHLHPDGTLGRPSPAECAIRLGLSHTPKGIYGLRPPYMHPARQQLVHLPSDGLDS